MSWVIYRLVSTSLLRPNVYCKYFTHISFSLIEYKVIHSLLVANHRVELIFANTVKDVCFMIICFNERCSSLTCEGLCPSSIDIVYLVLT